MSRHVHLSVDDQIAIIRNAAAKWYGAEIDVDETCVYIDMPRARIGYVTIGPFLDIQPYDGGKAHPRNTNKKVLTALRAHVEDRAEAVLMGDPAVPESPVQPPLRAAIRRARRRTAG